MSEKSTILVTGANGQLGRLVIDGLLKTVPAGQIAALVRSAEKGEPLKALGVDVRIGSYDDPDSLIAAFAGVGKLLLISSTDIGQRARQHGNAIAAAKAAGVGFIAYTSLLKADASPMSLATEHLATERALAASGVPHALLRNGWYLENHFGSIAPALAHGALAGSAGGGRFAAAARADYAAAAVAVLTATDSQAGKVFELAGDTGFTLADWAATLSDLAGKPVVYADMPEAEYRAMLIQVGLPEPVAAMLADADVAAASGWLDDGSRTLSRLIGRPTQDLRTALATALAG